MNKLLLTGIDVGTSKITTLVAQLLDDGDFEVFGVGHAATRGIRKGVVVNVDEASQAIRESVERAERLAGFEIGTAFVNLAGSHIESLNSNGVVGISGNRGITEDDIDRALDAARAIAIPHNREVLHIIPRGFTVDGQEGVRSPLGMHGFRLEVEAHIVTAAKAATQNLTKCVENAGVMVEGFVLNPLAAAETVLTDTEREMGVIVCDIGGGTTDLAVFIEGNVWHTSVIAVGGNHITADIAHGLRLQADVAEQIKLEYGFADSSEILPSESFNIRPFGYDSVIRVSRSDLVEIIEARVEEIFSLVRQEIKRSGYDNLLPAGIVLTGGTAQLPGIRTVANRILNLPARIGEPRNVRGLVDKIQGTAFASTVGLLHWAARETLAQVDRPKAGKSRSNWQFQMPSGSSILDLLRRLAP